MVKLFIGNCGDECKSDDLRDVFAKYGRVMEAEVIPNKGFGFVVSLLFIICSFFEFD